MAALTSLPLDDLCTEIAAVQLELAIETAQATRAIPDKERPAARRRLRLSRSDIDRLAWWLLTQWEKP